MLGSGLVWSDSMWGEVSGARRMSDAGLKGSFSQTLGQFILDGGHYVQIWSWYIGLEAIVLVTGGRKGSP